MVISALLAGLACAWAALAAPSAPGPYFTGHFRLVPLVDVCQPRRVLPSGKAALCPVLVNGHQYYSLGQAYALHLVDGTVLAAPAGMTTDLASIPPAVWGLLPPDGPWGQAAGIHDDCYRTRGTFVWTWHQSTGPPPVALPAKTFAGLVGRPPLVRAECDEALRQGMVALQVPTWKRVVIYEAVRLAGANGWGH